MACDFIFLPQAAGCESRRWTQRRFSSDPANKQASIAVLDALMIGMVAIVIAAYYLCCRPSLDERQWTFAS